MAIERRVAPDKNVDSGRMRRLTLRALLAFASAAALAIALGEYIAKDDTVSNDAAQYLVGASSLLEGTGYTTSILYFDEHFATGTIPAPQTVWSPGYPAGIAALAATGLPLLDAARIWSIVCYAALLPCLVLLVWHLTQSAVLATAAAFWQLAVTEMWLYSAEIATELAFCLTIVAMALVFVRDLRANAERARPFALSLPALAAINCLAGVAFLLRYAGVFPLAWSLLLIAFDFVTRMRNRAGRPGALLAGAALAALPAVAVFIAVTARNYAITGGIRGGNNKLFLTPVVDLLTLTGQNSIHLLTGVTRTQFFAGSVPLGLLGGLALAFLGSIAVVATLRLCAPLLKRDLRHWRTQAVVMLTVLVVLYVSGMVAIASQTFISYDARYLLPVIPLCIALAVALARFDPRLLFAGIAILAATQILAHDRRSGRERGFEYTASAYADLADWLMARTPQDEVIMVVGDGQRIGYYARRPTLAVPVMRYTSHEWSESELRAVAARFGARTLVVARTEDPDAYGPFPASLLRGERAAWLAPLATLEQAFVYRMDLDVAR